MLATFRNPVNSLVESINGKKNHKIIAPVIDNLLLHMGQNGEYTILTSLFEWIDWNDIIVNNG